MREITLGDVLDAMERDTRPKIKRSYANDYGACALGGASLELGLWAGALGLNSHIRGLPACPSVPSTSNRRGLVSQIMYLNDKRNWSKKHIARALRDANCLDLSTVVLTVE